MGALALAFGLLLVDFTAFAAHSALKLDRVHSKLGFAAGTLLFDVDGKFNEYTIEIEGNPNKPRTVKVKLSIDAASIDTQNPERDAHLRGADWFDVENHAQITFISTSVRPQGDELVVKGNLTIRGKTEEVTIPLKIARGKNTAGVDTTTYRGTLTVRRNDFGIGVNDVAAQFAVDDDVELELLVVSHE